MPQDLINAYKGWNISRPIIIPYLLRDSWQYFTELVADCLRLPHLLFLITRLQPCTPAQSISAWYMWWNLPLLSVCQPCGWFSRLLLLITFVSLVVLTHVNKSDTILISAAFLMHLPKLQLSAAVDHMDTTLTMMTQSAMSTILIYIDTVLSTLRLIFLIHHTCNCWSFLSPLQSLHLSTSQAL